MSFQAIAVRQVVTATLTNQGSSITITPSSAVAAGSTLVLVGAARVPGTGEAGILNSVTDSQSNTWGSPTNAVTSASYNGNAFACVALNVAAGTPTLTASFNQSSGMQVSWALLEVEKVPTSGVVDKTVTGVGVGGVFSTSTGATGTLTQTDNLAILCASGPFGIPTNPTNWTSVLSQQHGAVLGAQISHRTTAATTSFVGTVEHDADGSFSSAVMLVLKAAAAGAALYYEFLLNPSTFTSADIDLTAFVWRNGDPDQVIAEKYTGLSGSATAGTLVIDTGLPVNVALTDTLLASVFNATDGSRPLVAGTVKEV
jgi:hypothetical protein